MKNVNVRLDDELHSRVTEAAGADHRSLNGEIISLLQSALSLRVQVQAGALAAQHTYTAACDGFHPPGPCPQ